MKRFIFCSYSFFLMTVTVISYFFVDPHLADLQWFYRHFQINDHILKALILLMLLCIFYVYYLVFLRMYSNKDLVTKDILLLVFLTVLILMFSYPAVFSFDIFNYIATAKVTFFYGENPYIIMPIQFTGDPLLAFMHAANKTALYGPSWILMTWFPFFFALSQLVAMIFLFKTTIIIWYLLLTFFIYKLSKSIHAVLFFSLNPLVVIETLIGSHNDVVMMGLVFLSLYFLLRRRFGVAILLFILSVGIKYASIVLLPVLFQVKKFGSKKSMKSIFRLGIYLMLLIFLLSFIREEIYPWYAIWFLPFVALSGTRREKIFAVLFSFCLELRYFPYLFLLTHVGITPTLKTMITFVPVLLLIGYFQLNKLWLKK